MEGHAVVHTTFEKCHPYQKMLRPGPRCSRVHLPVALNLAKHPFDMAAVSEERTLNMEETLNNFSLNVTMSKSSFY